jgi:hypothetical protein
MPKKCADCPFHGSGPGLALRLTLRSGRWKAILKALAAGKFFPCHKTTTETGDGSNRVCRGSIEWQEKRGYSSAYVRLAKWLDSKESKA